MQREFIRRIQSNLLLLNRLKIGQIDPFILADKGSCDIEAVVKDSEVPLELLLKVVEHFDISLDLLVRHNLADYQDKDLKQVLNGYRLKTLKLPSETIVIKFITTAAASQYLVNPENDFPTFSLPRRIFEPYRLSTFRAFEIAGHSMPPVDSGSIIVCELMEDALSFKEGERYILIHPDGIFFKRVFKAPNYAVNNHLILKSDNKAPEYAPFEINALTVREMWKPFQVLSKVPD